MNTRASRSRGVEAPGVFRGRRGAGRQPGTDRVVMRPRCGSASVRVVLREGSAGGSRVRCRPEADRPEEDRMRGALARGLGRKGIARRAGDADRSPQSVYQKVASSTRRRDAASFPRRSCCRRASGRSRSADPTAPRDGAPTERWRSAPARRHVFRSLRRRRPSAASRRGKRVATRSDGSVLHQELERYAESPMIGQLVLCAAGRGGIARGAGYRRRPPTCGSRRATTENVHT